LRGGGAKIEKIDVTSLWRHFGVKIDIFGKICPKLIFRKNALNALPFFTQVVKFAEKKYKQNHSDAIVTSFLPIFARRMKNRTFTFFTADLAQKMTSK
jgi:hypothetical protein